MAIRQVSTATRTHKATAKAAVATVAKLSTPTHKATSKPGTVRVGTGKWK